MPADLVMKAGPFLGRNPEGEIARLSKQMKSRGCPHIRAHMHGLMLIIEGWRYIPDEPGPLPSAAFIEALIHGELPNGVVPQ